MVYGPLILLKVTLEAGTPALEMPTTGAHAAARRRELKGASGTQKSSPPTLGQGGKESKHHAQGQDDESLHPSFFTKGPEKKNLFRFS